MLFRTTALRKICMFHNTKTFSHLIPKSLFLEKVDLSEEDEPVMPHTISAKLLKMHKSMNLHDNVSMCVWLHATCVFKQGPRLQDVSKCINRSGTGIPSDTQ